MVKELMHDSLFLAGKSGLATKEDFQVAQDLLDTLIANKDGCVVMSANMLDVHKRIIVFDNEGAYMTMCNPEIIKIITRMVTFLCSAVPVRANDTKPSKFSGKPMNFKLASKLLPIGPRELFNTKSTIVMGC